MNWIGALALGLLALTLGMILWSGLSARDLRGRAVDELFPLLPGLAEQQARAVIYCYTVHCGPCRKMGRQIDRLAASHRNLFKLDLAEHPKQARALGIRATPTTLLVEDGRVLKALIGAGAIAAIEVFLETARPAAG